MATQVALDPAFKSNHIKTNDALVINQHTHNALLQCYKAQNKQANPLQYAIRECQRLYERQRRGVGYFTRQDFASSADYATYIQPFLMARCKTNSLKGQSLAPWQMCQKLKALLQF